MSDEYFALKKLLMKRDELEREATSLRSPGFEEHYNASRSTCAGFEDRIIEAVDMEEEIEAAMLAFVRRVERENKEILDGSTGQRQRILRLRFIAHKSMEDIADILDISVKTVQNRQRFKDNGPFFEPQYLLADAEVEKHIVWMYETLQGEIGEKYIEVERLIDQHRRLAKAHRRQYDQRVKETLKAIDTLTGITREIVERRMLKRERWQEIADAVGYTERWTRHLYSEILNTSAFSRIHKDFV